MGALTQPGGVAGRLSKSCCSVALASSVLFATADPSFSEGKGDFLREGWYVGGSAAFQSHVFADDLEDDLRPLGPNPEITDSSGFRVYGGYRFLPWFAADVSYEWVEGIDTKLAGRTLWSRRASSVMANARFILPVYERFQPYVVGGIGGMAYRFRNSQPGFDMPSSQVSFAARIGAGADIYATKNWALNMEFSAQFATQDLASPFKDNEDLQYYSGSVGILYRF